ncbi:MAG TPA: flavin reductase family protein [Acidimicrobiales bacterium]|nr:flavin reductase family protein [Acidimicrobiales bacterium]
MGELTPDSDQFRTVLGHFTSGVVVVTSSSGEEPVGLTAQSFSSLSLDPPMVLFCVGRTSTTWPRFRDTGRFCVHVLSHDQEDVARQFARSGADKFAGVNWAWGPFGNPVIDGCLAYIECRMKHVYDEGDHHLITADVLDLRLGEGGEPLLFYRGEFRRIFSPA